MKTSNVKIRRQCGDCTECCTALGVDEINKPRDVACQHLAGDSSGCSIYQTRPASCRAFNCVWLLPAGMPKRMKPIKTKIVPYATDGIMGRGIVLAESEAGALDSAAGKEVSDHFTTLGVMVFTRRVGEDIAVRSRGKASRK